MRRTLVECAVNHDLTRGSYKPPTQSLQLLLCSDQPQMPKRNLESKSCPDKMNRVGYSSIAYKTIPTMDFKIRLLLPNAKSKSGLKRSIKQSLLNTRRSIQNNLHLYLAVPMGLKFGGVADTWRSFFAHQCPPLLHSQPFKFSFLALLADSRASSAAFLAFSSAVALSWNSRGHSKLLSSTRYRIRI